MRTRRPSREPLPFLEPERLHERDVATVQMAAALLLTYPDTGHGERLAAVRDAVEHLPIDAEVVARDLRSHLDAVERWDAEEAQVHYVETFDLRRRCSLHLTFYSAGDTRRRGMALVRFREAFRAAGFEPDDADELPDHLPLVLEMSARGGTDIAAVLLGAHRQGVELLRSALHHVSSPYAHVLDAVCRTLPPVSPEAQKRFTDLLTEGPPQEMVGLAAPLLPFPTAPARG